MWGGLETLNIKNRRWILLKISSVLTTWRDTAMVPLASHLVMHFQWDSWANKRFWEKKSLPFVLIFPWIQEAFMVILKQKLWKGLFWTELLYCTPIDQTKRNQSWEMSHQTKTSRKQIDARICFSGSWKLESNKEVISDFSPTGKCHQNLTPLILSYCTVVLLTSYTHTAQLLAVDLPFYCIAWRLP